jgi:mono/diheme cytochrome c family protein
MSGVHGYLRGGMLGLAAGIGLSVPVLAQDSSDLAAGQNAWNRAGCTNCHGSRAQGGDGGDYPVGPSLRNIKFDKATMVEIVSCGRPGTPMPAWLKGAYTTVQCYGMPLGSMPEGMTVPAIFTADEIKALVDYVFATFVQTPRP